MPTDSLIGSLFNLIGNLLHSEPSDPGGGPAVREKHFTTKLFGCECPQDSSQNYGSKCTSEPWIILDDAEFSENKIIKIEWILREFI